MLPTKFRFIWPSGFRGEDFFQKSTNQKQELSVAAMSVSESERNEQSQQRIFHRFVLPSFGPFGQLVSEEKNLKNQPIRNKNRMWRLCLLTERVGMSNLYRGPSIVAAEPQPFMVLFIFFYFLRTIGLRFSLYQKLSILRKKNLAPLFCQFLHETGCENDQTYIFRFVRYLSTFFYTYLPINIHFQFIIITNISFVTNPAYFVRHLASPVVSF